LVRKYFSLLFFLLSLAAVPTAFADTENFSFSFTGSAGLVGTVTGEIDGLENNATSSATAVFIDTATNNAGGDTLPYNVLNSHADVIDNTFTVTNGVITGVYFFVDTSFSDPSEPDFNALELNGYVNGTNTLGFGFGQVINYDGLSGVTYTELPSAAAPEPATAGYFLEGLAAVALLSWRRFGKQPARLTALRGFTLSL
jgi:hypothetical protein